MVLLGGAVFFEGSEKKVEIVLAAGGQDLRNLERSFWDDLVAQCKATILSHISNQKMQAFLLSESSLFVWNDRIVMITCGGTVLINSILSFVDIFGVDAIDSIIYQRKNEYDPRRQESSFMDDVAILKNQLTGVALRFGHLDGHHNYLFNLEKKYAPAANDMTCELLMYQIQGPAADVLRANQSAKNIRELIGFDKIAGDFAYDDFAFSPYGYSLNGIRGEDYITMHITPQEDSSYISFETNIDLAKENVAIIEHLIDLFKPNSFDLITFNTNLNIHTDYLKGPLYRENISCGYNVSFKQYFKQSNLQLRAIKL